MRRGNRFDDVRMIEVIVDIHLAAAEIEFGNLVFNDRIHVVVGQQVFCFKYGFTRFRINGFTGQNAADELVAKEVDSLAAGACQAGPFADEVDAEYVAVVFADDNVLGNVDETAGQVARVSRTKRRISQPFTSTVRRCEVVQYGQAFTEVCLDRQVDDTARRVSHQTTHTGNLTNLLFITTGTGVSHHEDRVEGIHVIHHDFRNVIGRFFPNSTGFAIPFIFRNETALIHLGYVLYLFVSRAEDVPFSSGI